MTAKLQSPGGNMKTMGRMITAVLVMVGSANLLFAQNTVPLNSKDARPSLKDTTRAAEYFNKGKALAKAAQFDSSNAYYLKANEIYEKLAVQHKLETMWEKTLQSFNSMGWNFIMLGKYDDAQEYLNEALSDGLQKFGKNHVVVAKSYFTIGVLYGYQGDYDKALEQFRKSLSIRQRLLGEEHPEVATSYNSIGIVYDNKGDYDKALEYSQKALSIRHRLLGDEHLDVAKSYISIGTTYSKLGDYDKALEYSQKALSIRVAEFGDEHPEVASSFMGIGNIYCYKGDYDRALEYHQKAASIRLRTFGDEHPDVANSYINIGAVYFLNGDYDKALEYYQKALSIYLQNFEEEHPNVATGYNNIGLVYSSKGDYDRALEYYQKALSIALRIFGEEHRDVANSYINIGAVYKEKGDYDRALVYHQKAASILLRIFGDEHPDVAHSYVAIGFAYEEKGDYDRALVYHQKAASILLRIFGDEHPDVALSYDYIGRVYSYKGDYDRAIAYLYKALCLLLKVLGEFHPEVADIYRDLAEVYYQQHDFGRALTYCQKSILSQVSGFDDPSIYSNPPLEGIRAEIYLLNALKLKAEVLARRSDQTGREDLAMAFTTYQLIAELIDKMRTGFKAEGSRLFLGGKAVEIYEKAVDTALRLYQITADEIYKEAAFRFAEKSKASVLSQALRETQAKAFAGIPDTVLAKESQLRIDLAFYETQLQKERQKKENRDEARIEDFQNRYFSLNAEYQSLIEELEKTYPRYYDLKYESKTVSIIELQERLDRQTTVVEYFTGERSIYIFTVTKSHFAVTTVAKDTLFETDIERFRAGIERHDSQLYVRSARQLYRSLIHPVRDHLKTKSLIIIPDHVIAHIPFEALLADDDTDARNQDYASLPYLLRKYEISYAYSATLLLELLNQDTPEPPRDYLAFAPVFPDGLVAGSRAEILLRANLAVDSSRAAHTYLPASRDEVVGIQKLFRQSYGFLDRWSDWLFGNKTSVYLESQANEENLKKIRLKNYRYIHFATHGFANKTTPDLSGLLLAQNSDSEEDDVLFLNEVYNLELNADLVTLSACETGIGKSVKGEGLLSLSRGFFYAGAKNLLVSLWKADDQATCELMLAFYREMLKGKSKAEALRHAKLQLLEREWQKSEPRHLGTEYADPSCWASFILVGK